MNKFDFTKLCRNVWHAPRNAVRNVRFLWQHGPISREEAERVDRLCNPRKYMPQADSTPVEEPVGSPKI
jgi:hypothetical protein